ncbi:MAG: hypothetical protein KDC71_10770 [Acidobacteria bacterium]|nr:hypothetical protein [Acidobacteriota bacterium]
MARRIWVLLFLCRVPLLASLVLIALPLLALKPLASMVGALFYTEHLLDSVLAAAMACWTALVCVFILHVLLLTLPDRFHLQLPFAPSRRFYLLLAVGLSASPVVVLLIRAQTGTATWGVLLGVVLSSVVAGLVLRFKEPVQSMAVFRHMRERAGQRLHEAHGYGGANQLLAHLQAGGLLVFVAILYFGSVFFWLPNYETQAPALYFVWLLQILVILLFSGLSFFLDYYRVPVVALSLLAWITLYTVFDVDHFFRVQPPQTKWAAEPTDMRHALEKRLARQEKPGKTLVVVAASGGGIQASAWTARVLTGLQQVFGSEFTDQIVLVSSVSGGSTGTLNWLDRFDASGHLPDSAIAQVMDQAMADGLPATAWGFAGPDFARSVGLPWLVPAWLDRGWALEQSWKRHMARPEASVIDWNQRALAGDLPIPVFNATVVETGDRALIAPFFFPFADKAISLKDLCQGDTLQAVTAARLSATFPYVTPIARPWSNDGQKAKQLPSWHLADGGYFDNFGAFTVLEWLDHFVLPDESIPIEKIVMIQINAFPRSKPPSAYTHSPGWKYSLLGPVMALAAVRTSTQIARNQAETGALQAKWSSLRPAMQWREFDIRFDLTEEGKTIEPPLSWKLTPQQKVAIDQAWQELVANPNGTIAELKTFLAPHP